MVRAFHAEEGRVLDPASEGAVRALAGGEPLARGWILRSGGRPAGYVVLTLGFSIEYGGRDGFIDDLWLAPELRSAGLGARLLAFAVEQAAALGIRTLHLEVEPDNDRAMGLYRRAGFEETGRRLMRRRIAPPGGS